MEQGVSKGVSGTSNSYATVHKTHPNLEEPAPGPSRHPPGPPLVEVVRLTTAKASLGHRLDPPWLWLWVPSSVTSLMLGNRTPVPGNGP